MGKQKKPKRKVWTVVLIIVMAIGSVLLGGFLIDAPGRNEIWALTFSDVKFNNLRDGTYVGEYKGTKSHSRDTKVEITVSGGVVSDIKILDDDVDEDKEPENARDSLKLDLLIEAIHSQSLQVDAISGATLTSKTYLKALESALKQAQQE